MATGSAFLEDSNGGRVDSPSEESIRSTVEKVGAGLDHCILHLGGASYVQTAGDHNRLLLQYADETGMHESAKVDFDVETVTAVFVGALNGNNSWKTEYNFRSATGGNAPQSTSAGRPIGGGAPSGSSGRGGSIKDQVLGQVKREVSREASYGLGSVIRRFLRSLFGRR